MEQSLDDIAEGEKKSNAFLKGFFGPFSKRVEEKTKEVKKDDVLKEYELGIDPASGLPVVARTGRFGPYVQLGRLEKSETAKGKGKKSVKKKEHLRTASLPKTLSPEHATLEQALALLAFPKVLGTHGGEEVRWCWGDSVRTSRTARRRCRWVTKIPHS
jgi:DNA topoisomerase I